MNTKKIKRFVDVHLFSLTSIAGAKFCFLMVFIPGSTLFYRAMCVAMSGIFISFAVRCWDEEILRQDSLDYVEAINDPENQRPTITLEDMRRELGLTLDR